MRAFLASLLLLSVAPACAPEDLEPDTEHFYTEAWDQAFFEGKDDGVRLGRFETFTGEDGRRYFHLLAGNGQKVLHSQGYADGSGVSNGIDSVRENGADTANYRVLEAADGRWYFNLVAGNGQVIGTSQLYTTRSSAERGLGTVASLVEGANQRQAVRRAAFQVFRGLDGQYYFHLRSQNGQIVLVSEGYTRRSAALAGTAAVESNGADLGRYQVRDAAGNQAYFVLRATNGEVIATSETYASRAGAQRAAAAVADLLETATIQPAE
jgi:uncharacterized protein YegP (UPF0339 family)